MQPKRKVDVILENISQEIDRLLKLPELDEVGLARISKQTEQQLKKENPIYYYVVMGLIAMLKIDIESVHYYFKQAINISGVNKFVSYNYSTALRNMIESRQIFIELYKKQKSDIQILDETIKMCLFTGSFFGVREFLDEWQSLNSMQKHPKAEKILNIVKFMTDEGLTDEMLEPLYILHFKTLQQYGVFTGRIASNTAGFIFIENFEGFDEIHHEVYFDKSPSETVEIARELSWKIAEAIANKELSPKAAQFAPLYLSLPKDSEAQPTGDSNANFCNMKNTGLY